MASSRKSRQGDRKPSSVHELGFFCLQILRFISQKVRLKLGGVGLEFAIPNLVSWEKIVLPQSQFK